ncbi:ABC transporter ATP-binding protein [Butyrivibrio sp. AE2032]|uniref:ABC transporter ATP-binding protein n=1 Tax=Butyrivibrio sp. AE2032 TaxID=1458463 RepID=UPI00054D612C|nr:ABC transporter ATP-binding protein [Butyrivibrio sp. AE2032]
MNTIIEVSNVSKTFGKGSNLNKVLDDACMYVGEGEFVSLMGASGSGKSTLLYLIGGLDRDLEGKIELCGRDITTLKDDDLSALRLEKVGFVFQFYNLVMNLNVEDNILLPSTINGRKRKDLEADLDEILEITGLTDKRKAMPATLSGGQQQRVAIARAVLGNPSVLLADEPTGNLDSKSSKEIMELFAKLNREKGLTILQVTHSEKCASYGTRTIILENGKTVG